MVPDFAPANVIAGLVRRIERLESDQRETASTARTLESAWIGAGGLTIAKDGLLTFLDSAARKVMVAGQGIFDQLDPDTGGAISFRNGQILLWDNYLETPDAYGRIRVDQGSGKNLLRIFPPYDAGSGLENSFTIRGKTPTQPGAWWAYTDGVGLLQGAEIGINPTDGVLTLYSLPTTSGGYLLRYNQVGGKWTVALDSSSRRYKHNIEDATIDPADVLKWRPRRWQDVNQGDDAPWNTGLIAEEVDEAGTPEFVIYDQQGRPDGIRKEILAVGQQVVLQDHEQRLVVESDRNDEQDEKIAALEAENQRLREELAAEKKARSTFEAKISTAFAKLGVKLT